MVPDVLLGPVAALAGAIVAIAALYRLVREYIADLRAQRDVAITGWRAQTEATNRLATALEAQNRRRGKGA